MFGALAEFRVEMAIARQLPRVRGPRLQAGCRFSFGGVDFSFRFCVPISLAMVGNSPILPFEGAGLPASIPRRLRDGLKTIAGRGGGWSACPRLECSEKCHFHSAVSRTIFKK
jgi:hypothetical protein